MKDDLIKVVEIFKSIDGEGSRAGLPCTFLRLQSCNLRCSYCDSRYACEGDDYTVMTDKEVVQQIEDFGIPAVTVTGGEPLLFDSAYNVIEALAAKGYWVNIETNGSIHLGKIKEICRRVGNVMITMDWKCKSSNMSDRMCKQNLSYLNENDVLKFVVGTDEDLQQMKDLLNTENIKAAVYVSPVFGEIDPKHIVQFLLDNKLYNVKIQLQLHKFIWDPNMRGV